MKVYSYNLRKALELRKLGIPEARVWLEKACADGDAEALYFKYIALRYGGFFIKPASLAVWSSCLYESAKLGCVWAKFGMGQRNSEPDYYFQELLKTGDNFVIAECYFFGLGVAHDRALACNYFIKAQHEGNCPRYIGGLKNEDWLKKGAMDGDASFQFAYALSKKGKDAFYWFNQAAKQEHAEAQYKLGIRYLEGNGTNEDMVMAAKCFVSSKSTFVITVQLKRLNRQDVLFVYGQAA